MCLGVPMKLVEFTSDDHAIAQMEGSSVTVNVSLISEPQIGDFIIVHAGYAIERLNQDEANARLTMFSEIAQQHQQE